MTETVIVATSVLVGALVGRWWIVILAVPAGLAAQSAYSFEGFSDTEVGVLFGIAVAIGLVVGTAVRKVLGILARQGTDTSQRRDRENVRTGQSEDG